jgi:hypothetical protein
MLPPHSKGVPDLSISDMRSPFETFIQEGQTIDESLGQRLAAWAIGVQDWEKEINTAATPEALAALWSRMPKDARTKYTAAKDARKAALSSTVAPI